MNVFSTSTMYSSRHETNREVIINVHVQSTCGCLSFVGTCVGEPGPKGPPGPKGKTGVLTSSFLVLFMSVMIEAKFVCTLVILEEDVRECIR